MFERLCLTIRYDIQELEILVILNLEFDLLHVTVVLGVSVFRQVGLPLCTVL